MIKPLKASNRIAEQRELKDWTQEQLADKVGTHKQQIWKLEHGKIRLSQDWMERIASALGCRVVDLLPHDPNISRLEKPRKVASIKQPLGDSSVIEEVDVRISSGDGALGDTDKDVPVVAEWSMPSDFVRSHTSTPMERLKIVQVTGDSNVPDFMPGERVLVDTEDTRPSPPGVFVLWDGIGLVMKRVEVIPNSNPISVRLIPRNPLYATYERPLEDVRINARVIGKWART